jgi:hypothetical protein
MDDENTEPANADRAAQVAAEKRLTDDPEAD